jgi:hypothetical protein
MHHSLIVNLVDLFLAMRWFSFALVAVSSTISDDSSSDDESSIESSSSFIRAFRQTPSAFDEARDYMEEEPDASPAWSLHSVDSSRMVYPLVVDFAQKVLRGKLDLLAPLQEVFFEQTNPFECRPLAVVIDGAIQYVDPEPLDIGTGVDVYRLGSRYILKMIVALIPGVSDGMVVDRVVMEAMNRSPVGSAEYGIADIHDVRTTFPILSDSCRARIIITDRVPGTSIFIRAFPEGGPRTTLPFADPVVFQIAAGALRALQRFHRSGFAHGDIHWGNFMIGDTIRLIDLGLANPYVDEYGVHIPPDRRIFLSPKRVPPNLLSPWHIESNLGSKYRSTRRDDMFRLAEMLFTISSDAYRRDALELSEFRAQDSVVIEFKRTADSRRYSRIPETVNDFYQYTLSLGFDTAPDYLTWIDRFTRP